MSGGDYDVAPNVSSFQQPRKITLNYTNLPVFLSLLKYIIMYYIYMIIIINNKIITKNHIIKIIIYYYHPLHILYVMVI